MTHLGRFGAGSRCPLKWRASTGLLYHADRGLSIPLPAGPAATQSERGTIG